LIKPLLKGVGNQTVVFLLKVGVLLVVFKSNALWNVS